MKIIIPQNECIHLTQKSHYNSNYYELPFIVNGCNIIYSSYDGGENFEGHSVGVFNNDKYEPKYWLHTEDKDNEFIIDSELIQSENNWT